MKAELIDCMGSDLSVVNAARVSFDNESEWEHNWDNDTSTIKTELALKDQKLINYLANHNHWTPFSHCIIQLRETVPIFVARQRFKHTVGFTYNETSRRYVDDPPEFYSPSYWRGRADNKKQGSSDEKVEVADYDLTYEGNFGDIEGHTYDYEGYNEFCKGYYEHLLAQGVAPEQARMVLPQSMYTSYYVTGSLAAFARAYKLRSEEHAQAEIRELAEGWGGIIKPLFPVSWAALTS